MTADTDLDRRAGQSRPRQLLRWDRRRRAQHPTDNHWYKDAVFYEVPVQSFKDSNRDGIGDLRGVLSKLDYLDWLGVNCIWLLPVFDSPLRDGGYDVQNFYEVQPRYGTTHDLQDLLNAAHARGMRVIMDLPLNHTSVDHDWFQESSRDPDGPYGDFYVWSDDPSRFPDARIIFTDFETSNWAWDDQRQQYYWHRFYNHQADLNYDSPAVRHAIIDVVRYWFERGVDGFRLDAAPYLFITEGTDGENLPETHGFLRELRRVVQEEFPGRVLLAEANQWADQAVHYFGAPSAGGDECHMAFHFPLMPRLFMALRLEDSAPVERILAATPEIPASGQWAIFLRNHDELTLEMVTPGERELMLREYARHPRARINLGIRRRLASLVDRSRREIELLTALLLSLPGSPVLYYGDEIGMGDNLALDDRDGVRTPMQWSADPAAGFSASSPASLHLPAIHEGPGSFTKVNVEDQLRDPDSLLHWTQRMIQARRKQPAFGRGELQVLPSSSRAVLAFLREDVGTASRRASRILCVNNLSSRAQSVSLDLPELAGQQVHEVLGGELFPMISHSAYQLTLPAHGFLWLSIQSVALVDGQKPTTSRVVTA